MNLLFRIYELAFPGSRKLNLKLSIYSLSEYICLIFGLNKPDCNVCVYAGLYGGKLSVFWK